jgi:nucleotide-binding universal stress UspA family protein
MVDYSLDPRILNQVENASETTSKKMLRDQLAKFPDSKSIELIADIRRGVHYVEISNYQQEKKIDLIVISSHGKTGLLSHLIGSVAEKVVRSAKCSVLLVR